MKKILYTGILMLFLVVMLNACKNGNKTASSKSDTTSAIENNSFDLNSVKEQALVVIEELSQAPDIVPLLNKAGASYIYDLTIPVENAEKMLSQSQKGFFWGMVVFDMMYAKVYNRNDVLASVSNLEYQFKMDLGLEQELNKLKAYNDRIKSNQGNQDSITALIDASSKEWFSDMSDHHLDVLVYSFIGNNVEALYILTQLTLLANDSAPLLAVVNEQKEHVVQLFDLLELVANDENVKPYYNDMAKVASYFNAQEEINNKVLEEIAPLVGTVRNRMIN